MKSSKLKTKLDITFCVLFYEKIEGTNDCYLLTDDEYFLAQVLIGYLDIFVTMG